MEKTIEITEQNAQLKSNIFTGKIKAIRKKEKHFKDALCDDLNHKINIVILRMGK